MDINGADNNDILSKNSSIPLEDQKAFVDIQNFMAIDSALLKPKSASPLCVGPVDDMGFLSDGGLGPETDVDGLHDTKQQTHQMFSEEEDESPVLDNGDAGHGFVSNLEQNTIGDYNPFGLTSDVMVEALGNVPEDISNEIEEEEPSSVSAEPVDLSEDHAAHEIPHLNGSGEHHFDEPTEAGQLIDAVEEEDAVPAMKAELNENELAPLKSGDEPIVNDLLGGDSIVDNKLIDQLDSFGISDAIRRQLIEQQVTGATMNHEQEEDEDDGQLMEEKHSELDGGDDGAEKGDVHHEKAFDSDNVNVSDHHSADVKQDDDAGCCEDSEEDEWDYVKVNQQQQEQQQEQHNQQEQPQTQEKPQESTPPEETVESQFGNSNSFATEHQEEEKEELVEKHSEEQTHELEQHRDQEAEQEKEQQQQQQEEQAEVLYQEQEREAEVQLDETAEPNTSETPVDILGDNTESTVSESTKEVDDVIIVGGGEAKEVVNLLNDFNEDVPQPAAIETLCDTSNINEEDSSAVHLVPSDSTNMEAKLHEKHLDEAEEKTMHQGAAGDLGWQLNPEAKEFVPVLSPTDELTNVFPPARMLEHESFKLRDDAIVSQSPRKGTAPSMEDLDLPAEREFQTEMDKRPHEFEAGLEEGGEQQSQLSPNPFDQLDDRAMPGNGLDLMNGGELLQPEAAELLSPGKIDPVQFGTTDTASAEELELLNKVQELPVTEDEEQQEQLIAQQHYEPVQTVSLQGQEELGVDVMEPETYSAKEELYVEQKETVDEPVIDAASPVSPEIVQDFSQLSMNGHTEKENATNPFAQDNAYFETSVPSDTPQAENDLFGTSDTHMDTTQATTEGTETMETEEEPKPRFYQESLLEASVYDPEPSLLSTPEPSAPADPEPSPEIASEPAAIAASAESEVAVEPPTEPLAVEVAPPVEEQPKEAEKLAEDNKTAVEAAASGVAAATAVVAAAAVAASAVAASKTAKPKVPAGTGAKKAGPTTTATKASSAASKDGTAKSTTSTATRVGSGAGAPAAASRKPTVPAVKKAPTTTAKPPAAASTNGVKEARPASSTAAARPSLAAKKPATDAAKTATTKTTAAPSVAAARTTKAATVPSSTTKTASASSTTRTAAPKAATTGTTTAAKATSRLSTTGTTTRTVTSRPSSAISTSSVPSKPASATTTTTVKRTIAAKTSNGTTTTDGVTKTTKTSTSTTTSSIASRTGATRPAGTGTAAKPSSTLAAKKPLDAKTTAAAGTKTAAAKPSTTTRTSLAPKPTATSPAVRKVQQNGVAKKPTAASPNAIKKVTVPPKKLEEQLPASNEIIPTTTNNIETNGNANESEAVIVAPPESADPLLVPVPQAM
uniref:Ataxin-2 C-terminal domain-containing protein n=1 Tax=Anopheles atroparvus TaxID=41427 RepID=A0A182ILW6_ANOAO